MRGLVATVLSPLVLLGACGNGHAAPRPLPHGKAALSFTERPIPNPHGRVYTEGAVQFVRISRSGASAERRVPARLEVPPATYRVQSFTRTCGGNCGNLDPASLACEARIQAPARVEIITGVGKRCSLRVVR